MQKTVSKKKSLQYVPKTKLVSSIPEKEKLKLENSKQREGSTFPPLEEILLEQFIKNTPYPNFRYFCPSCGSLDVCITIHIHSQKMIVDCLDCKKEWVKRYLHERKTTCLC